MGRPKKSELSCTTCYKAFSKKLDLQRHMKIHSSKQGKKNSDSNEVDLLSDARKPRKRSNYCGPCRKSFEDKEYKLHIKNEHQLLETNMDDSDRDDEFPYESGYVLLSKRRIKKEPETEDKVLLSDIKIEPMSDEDSSSSLPKKKKRRAIYLVNCPVCGVECKGLRALKYHQEFKHKNNKSSNTLFSDDRSDEPEDDPLSTEINSTDESDNSPTSIANVSDLNSSHTESGYHNMLVSDNITNQTNVQVSPISGNEPVKLLEIIPKFDCDSEEYMKWLKKFVQKAKNHKYPLPQFLCDNINHVQDEIASALNKCSGNLKKKSCHFYFMKMQNILAEVLLGQMRYKMLVDN